jgi:xanthine dehydrogenase accessory factor
MTEDWMQDAARLLRNEPVVVRVTVAQVRGSSPRETGAAMLVSPRAQAGTIGGGQLEWQAVERARRMLAEAGSPATGSQQLRLGPDLAQCCGGEVTLHFERLPAAQAMQEEAALAPPTRPLWIFGAGHVGSAVVRMLAEIPLFDVLCIDSRAALLPAAGAAHVHARHAAEPVELVGEAAPGTSFLVLTHDHELDYQLCAAILARGDAAWTGLIGSKSKAARFRSRLRRDGFPATAIAALQCPVGMPAIRSKLPAAIATGIVAQLLTLATQQAAAPAPATGCDADCRRCREKLPA